MKKNMIKIKRALISVSNKNGLRNFAKKLNSFGVEIVASGGTANFIENTGIKVIHVEAVTGFQELLGGRVKTLHPKIHSSILADRDNQSHIDDLKKIKTETIDLVVCDLYPFSDSINEQKNFDLCLENIDIGGISLLRGAAKNFKFVTVITDVNQYKQFINHLIQNRGYSTYEFRLNKAHEAFIYSSNYDFRISKWFSELNKKEFNNLVLNDNKIQKVLSYGENSHQKAAFYQDDFSRDNWGNYFQIQGKALSYNNHLDLDACLNLLNNFKHYKDSIVGIIKHTNPCGVAASNNIVKAFKKAISSDPVSAFGGIIVINKKVGRDLADLIVKNFYEMVVAPDFDKESLQIFLKKKNLRIISLGKKWKLNKSSKKEFRSVLHGTLVQEKDNEIIDENNFKMVTNLYPDRKQIKDLIFAWNVVKLVKSNAIVIVKDMMTIGIGSGQPSRVDSSKMAIKKALNLVNKNIDSRISLSKSVMASDAFFPFPDGITEAIERGICSIIQPGGSLRDNQVIDLANKKEISMVFTGIRSFKH